MTGLIKSREMSMKRTGGLQPPKFRSVDATMANVIFRALIAVTPLLASCASSGLYIMSDEWCARHLDASAAHCPENQKLAHRTAARVPEPAP